MAPPENVVGPDRTTAIITAVSLVLPSVIGLVRDLFAQAHPDDPAPTDAEVLAAFASTCAKSLAVDEAWLAAHPPAPPTL
jgi:hypothetical protein